MKPNSSLGDLRLVSTSHHHNKYLPYPTPFIDHPATTPTTPTNSLHIDPIPTPQSIYTLQQQQPNSNQMALHKCNSQTNIATTTIKFQITSPKVAHQAHSSLYKGPQPRKENCLENAEKEHLQQKIVTNNFNVLKPIDRNILHYEPPRKPKILFKKSKEVSFEEDFRVRKVLGKGKFGNVYSALHIPSHLLVAVKHISLQKMTPKIVERLVCEIKIQSFLHHPNCLELYKCLKEGNNLYLLLEHGDCSLFDKLRERKFFSEMETCYYVKQTIQALVHMHKQGIIHRDLKPENIVLVNNVVKLADFGWSIYLGKDSKRRTFCGTLDYVSPEIVMGNSYDEMVDAWSLGVLCYQLCTGHPPFVSKAGLEEETFRKILTVEVKFPSYLSEDIKELISGLLTLDPEKRMSVEQALGHRWVVKHS